MSELSELIERNKRARCPELSAAIARAEAAEMRVRELEDLIVRRYEAKTMGDQSQLDIDMFAEAMRIATKRREGK